MLTTQSFALIFTLLLTLNSFNLSPPTADRPSTTLEPYAVIIDYDTFANTITSESGYRATPDIPWFAQYQQIIQSLPMPERFNQKPTPHGVPYGFYVLYPNGRYSFSPPDQIRFSDIDGLFSVGYEFNKDEQLDHVGYRLFMPVEKTDTYKALLLNLFDQLYERNTNVTIFKRDELADREVLKDPTTNLHIMWEGQDGSSLNIFSTLMQDEVYYLIVTVSNRMGTP